MRILFAHEPRIYILPTKEVGLDPDVPLQKVELPKDEDEEQAEEEDSEEERSQGGAKLEKFECGVCRTDAQALSVALRRFFKEGNGGRRVHQWSTQGGPPTERPRCLGRRRSGPRCLSKKHALGRSAPVASVPTSGVRTGGRLAIGSTSGGR